MPIRTEREPWTQEEVELIEQLYPLARETRRQDPPDSENRKAGRKIADMVAARKVKPKENGEDEYTYYELSHQIQVPNRKTGVLETLDPRTLRRRMSRWEKEIVPASQAKHVVKGNDPGYIPPRVSYRTDEHYTCRVIDKDGEERFCERTPENTRVREWDVTDKETGKFQRHVVQEDCKRHYDYLNVERRRRRKEGVPPIPQDRKYSEFEEGGRYPVIDLRTGKPATTMAKAKAKQKAQKGAKK